jgi:mannose-6-phosphate isomerase-like protein (cupin superfamily)
MAGTRRLGSAHGRVHPQESEGGRRGLGGRVRPLTALETRFAREPLETESTAISYLRLAPGERVPWGHTHKQQEEVYVVVNGSGRVKLDEDLVDLKQWDAVRIPPETMRNVEGGPEGSS